MTEENAPVVEPIEEQPQPEEKPADKFKDDPTYKAMSQQLADLQREKAVREAAEEEARREAEIKELEAQGKHEEAKQFYESELERLRLEHTSEIRKRDLTAELLKAGFTNDLLITGAVAGYTEDSGTIQEYVQAIAEANADLLKNGSSGREPKDAPPAVGAVGGKPNWEQVKAWENSDKREDRIKARGILSEYRNTHGKYPY